jgi:hypothetical protein
MPTTFKVVGKKRKSRGLTRRAVAQMIKYPPSEFATIKVPRDPAARKEVATALMADTMGEKGPALNSMMPGAQWRGRGDYSQLWGATAPLRRMAGGWLRAGNEGTWRRAAGNFMGYTGMGDYTRAVDNSLVGQGLASAGIPMFGPEQQNYTVSKAEFITNIYAPPNAGEFSNLVLPLNPGLAQTFPWLSLVAPQFEEYEFEQLMFYWRPMVSDFNSSTGQVGEIVMATQYNPSEPPFSDISRAKNYMGAMSAKTSTAMNQGVECDPRKNSGAAGKYVRLGPLTGTNSDLKQYDQGNLNVMISGTPPAYNDQILGELWVTYTITLRKPKLPDTSGAAILRDYFQSSLDVQPPGPVTTLITAPQLIGAQNRLGGSISWSQYTKPGAIPTQALVFEYVFPDWFTGAAEIDVTFYGVTSTGGGSASEVWMNNVGGSPSSAAGYSLIGQIKEIEDLANQGVGAVGQPTGASPLPLASWSQSAGYVSSGTDHPTTLTLKMHVYVGENTSGQDNKVNCLTLQWIAASTAPTCAGYSVNVQEYNSAFNSTATGQPLLVDIDGNAVLSPWSS